MKKLLFLLILLMGGAVTIYYFATGEMPWVAVSEEEQQVIQLRSTVRTAYSQFQQDGRTASLSGIDTSGMASDCMSKIEQAEKDLEALRPRLKTVRASTTASQLASEIAYDKKQMH